jgi:23S rRNA (cytosine1962-C5)-methyltransferase
MIQDDPNTRPLIRFEKGRSKRFRLGNPWAFSNEVQMTAEARALPPGTLVTLIDAGDEKLGVASFNPRSLIAARLLAVDWQQAIDHDFLVGILGRALALRDTLYDQPWYRLVHSEADGLPGLVIDRYGDVLALQVNSAGMERLTPLIMEALVSLLNPRAIILKNDAPVRVFEGLELYDRVALGEIDGPVEVREGGLTYFADLVGGQKTGWFFDQRDNRAFMSSLAKGKTVLDVYSYGGGFALAMARAGAAQVTAVDRSADALELAAKAAQANNLALTTVRAEAYAELARLDAAQQRFDVVVVDPPAFVKSKKDLITGAKGYRKLARLAAPLIQPGGFLFAASCSHHMPAEGFFEETCLGVLQAGRRGRVIRVSGAGADHPLHPLLPESAYLKALVMQVD